MNPAKPLVIRRLDGDDIHEVAELEMVCFGDEPPPYATEASTCRVAESDGDILGFILFDTIGDRVWIHAIAVHPDNRRQGVGSRLVCDLVDDVDQLSLERQHFCMVPETNLAAQQFLRSIDFACVRVDREYFEDENAYVMRFDANCHHKYTPRSRL